LTGTNRIDGLVTASQIAAASAVVLVSLDVGLHVGRRHQSDLMAQHDQLARPMMRRRAGLRADEARVLTTKELDNFRASQPSLDDDLSSSVDP
jgi:hypothetical protein